MNKTYRNVALAAGGILVGAVAAAMLKRRTGEQGIIAQVLTARMSPDQVYACLGRQPSIFNHALKVNGDVVIDFSDDMRVIEWHVPEDMSLDGRLALIAAPGGRGTELHIAMRGEKYDVKDIVRRMKAILETGEYPVGERHR